MRFLPPSSGGPLSVQPLLNGGALNGQGSRGSLYPGDDPGGEKGADLLRYLGVLRERWRIILAVTFVVVAAVTVGTLLQKPIYRASGLMELRGQSSEVASVEALFQTQRLSNQFLETQYGVLRSPALARRAMSSLGLLGTSDSTARPRDSAGTAASRRPRRESEARIMRRVENFADDLMIDPVAGSNLVWIHYESPDPQLAARAVNATFEGYTRLRADAARAAVTQLANEVEGVRERLTTAERQLQAHARENGLTVVSARTNAEELPQTRLRILQQQLAEADADRYAKEALYELVGRRGEGLVESQILQELNVRLATLRGEHARLKATFLDDYPRTRELKGQIDEVEVLLTRERGRLREAITNRYLAAVRQQQLLQRAVAEQKTLVDGLGERTTTYRIMARDVEAQQDLYAKLQDRLRAAEVLAAVAMTDVNVVERAVAPEFPVRPVLADNVALALVIGLVLGVGVAFVREHVDTTVRTASDLDVVHAPLLGLIPSLPQLPERGVRMWANRNGTRTVLPYIPGRDPDVSLKMNSLKDAFLSLRTAVLFASNQRRITRSLLVTSAGPGDGKTTVSVNLAASLTRLGRRVLLIDADLRRPAAHRAFGFRMDRGLSEALRGEDEWTTLVHHDVVEGLDMLLAGTSREGPTELLSSDRLPALLTAARRSYDFVIVDAPALGINAADARILTSLVDGVVMVVRSGSTPRATVASLLRQVPNVVGVVLNSIDLRHFPPYYYSYGEEREQAASI